MHEREKKSLLLNSLLIKKMEETNLSFEQLPTDLEKWQNFLYELDDSCNNADPETSLEATSQEILKRKNEQVKILNRQLLETARLAGMSEVATSILHNIGNILNSTQVSFNLVKEVLTESQPEKILSIAEIIKEHVEKNDDYFISDPKGQAIPKFLIEMSHFLIKNKEKIENEVKNIEIHLEHIKEIVSLQKDISGVFGLHEKVYIPALIDRAIHLSFGVGNVTNTSETKINITGNIELEKCFLFSSFIIVDRVKFLQILVNLLRNAKEAIELSTNKNSGYISVTARKKEDKPFIEIIVKDNGAGVSDENLTRIFGFGFTTKKNGHGFGLHSSAIAARDLGGSLTIQSDGVGKGSSFILEIPGNLK